jgi:hypothetical protein
MPTTPAWLSGADVSEVKDAVTIKTKWKKGGPLGEGIYITLQNNVYNRGMCV